MKAKLVAITLSLLVIAFHTEAFGQGLGRGRGMGWGRDSAYQRLYDVATVRTVAGEVSEIEFFAPKRGMGQGVHLQLKSDGEILPVHLGPRWFLDEQDVQIDKGDHIKVKGSRITYKGKVTIIAAEVEKGEETLCLRDEDGLPRWAGWRRKNR